MRVALRGERVGMGAGGAEEGWILMEMAPLLRIVGTLSLATDSHDAGHDKIAARATLTCSTELGTCVAPHSPLASTNTSV